MTLAVEKATFYIITFVSVIPAAALPNWVSVSRFMEEVKGLKVTVKPIVVTEITALKVINFVKD